MKVVSIINYKGGVGKTTITANLAAELAWRGKNVLVIDLDAQASLTFSFIKPDEWQKKFEGSGSIKAWFDSDDAATPISLVDIIQSPPRITERLKSKGKLHVIYSHLGLINVDLDLATKLAGSNLSQSKKNFIRVHKRLEVGLAPLRASGKYDIVLIDCPPNFNIVTKTAIIASDYILVPTRPDALSTLGIDYLIRSITGLVKDFNDYASVTDGYTVSQINPKIVGVVFTMIQETNSAPISAQRTYIQQVKSKGDLKIFDSYIKRNDTLFADAPEYGVPVVLGAHSNYSHQSVVDGLESVTTEFANILGI